MSNDENPAPPEGWAWAELGLVCEVNPRISQPEDWTDETPVSFVPMAAVDDVSGAITAPEVRPVGEVWRGYTRFASNDVIFAKITPCMENGKAAIARNLVNGLGLGSTEFHVLRSTAGVIPEWVYHYVRQASFRGEAAAKMTGTAGQLRVPTAFMEEALIPVAPLPEQRCIIDAVEAYFTQLDAAIKALERAKANLERYKASVLQAACEGRLVPTEAELAREEGRAYESAEVLLEQILAERRAHWEEERWAYEVERAKKKAAQAERKAKGLPYYIRDLEPEDWEDIPEEEYAAYLPKTDKWKQKYEEPEAPDTSELPGLPEGWCWATIDQVTEDVTKGSSPNWQGFDYQEDGIVFVRSQNIGWGKLLLDELAHLSPEFNAHQKRSVIREDDVLLNIVGASIGRCARATSQVTGGNLNQAVAIIRLITPMVEPQYLVTYLISPETQHVIDLQKVDVARANISLADISNLAFRVPPLREQARIVEEQNRRLSIAEALEQALTFNLARAERLRQSILKRAFEGRLVPTEAELARRDGRDYEPADVLLRRIRGVEASSQGRRRKDAEEELEQSSLF